MKRAWLFGVAALAVGMGSAMAQTSAGAAAQQPITQTSCKDYMAMDATIKPKFIYFAEGHAKKGDPDAVLDIEGTEKLQPELDKFCQVHLDASAYERVMKSSMASEKTNR